MNILKKCYVVVLLLLFECAVNSDGSLILALLIKVIALKGALFIGTPIALGSFIIGQGLGFFAGNIAGGFAVLKAAQKYHEKEKVKWVTPTKGWGWHGPKYTKGYNKGYHWGNAIAHFVNNIKHQPSHHHHHHDHHDGYGYGHGYSPSYGYGTPTHHHSSYDDASYGIPSPVYDSYAQEVLGGYGGGYASPSGYQKKDVTMLDRIRSKLPTFLGGKPKVEDPPPSYAHAPEIIGGPFSGSYGSYSSVPMNSYYSNSEIPLPGPSYTQPSYSAPVPLVETYNPAGQEPQKVYEDAEYTYSSSPYAQPQPKRPQNTPSFPDHYPGYQASYVGPAKEYTGILTDSYHTIQDSKTMSYGGKPLGKPMGIPEFALPPSDTFASSSDTDEQLLNLASSLQNHAQIQKHGKTTLPNFSIEKFLEKKLQEKSVKARNEEQKKEVKYLIHTLRKAYLQQLEESLRNEDDSSEDDEKSEEASTTTTTPTPIHQKPKFGPFGTFSPNQFERRQFEESEDINEELSSTTENTLQALNSEQLEQVKLLYTFMEEIKLFFTLVSALDEDTCLQKMVCDVHANNASGQATEETANTYVANMIATFKIMDLIVPFDPSQPDDSTSKYRLAAKLGSIGRSSDVCRRYFTRCVFTSEEIIQLGNQISTTTVPPVESTTHLSDSTVGDRFQQAQTRKDDIEHVASIMPRV